MWYRNSFLNEGYPGLIKKEVEEGSWDVKVLQTKHQAEELE